jgi:hypothetical protein
MSEKSTDGVETGKPIAIVGLETTHQANGAHFGRWHLYDGVAFMKWTMDTYHQIIETIKRSDNTNGFVLLPKRWVPSFIQRLRDFVRNLIDFNLYCHGPHYAQAASVSFKCSDIL